MTAAELQRPGGLQFMQIAHDLFVLAISDQFACEFFAGVYLVALLVKIFTRQQHLCLDTHQGRRHDDEFTGQINIELLHLADIDQEIICDPGDRYIVDVHLVPLYKKKQQVKWTLEYRKLDLVVHSVRQTYIKFFYGNGYSLASQPPTGKEVREASLHLPEMEEAVHQKMKRAGNLLLIPVPLAEEGLQSIPPAAAEAIRNTRLFIAERARTARHWIRQICPDVRLSDLTIYELDKHGSDPGLLTFLLQAADGHDIGLLSEAGCPGVADPGAEIVRLAHQHRIRVQPLAGPSSILMALMASGFSGQQFHFHGYLPPQRPELKKALRDIEQRSGQEGGSTQLFIETPYRNLQVWQTAIETLKPATRLCLVAGLDSPDEWIRSSTIAAWPRDPEPPVLKVPCVFLISAH